MKTINFYEEEMKDPEFAKLMAEESLILEITEKIIELMQKEKISKANLAKRLKKSKGYITQLLDGSRNFTIKTIADIFHVLGYSLKIEEDKYKQRQGQGQDNYKTIDNVIFFRKRKKNYNIKNDYKIATSLDEIAV